jgi:hypothetical protein
MATDKSIIKNTNTVPGTGPEIIFIDSGSGGAGASNVQDGRRLPTLFGAPAELGLFWDKPT